MLNYWNGKEPCWSLLSCSRYVLQKCPAHLHPERPCWENPYTQSEALLDIRKDCKTCKIFKLYSPLTTTL